MSALLLNKAWRDVSVHRRRTSLAVAALTIALMAAGVVLAAQEIMKAAIADQYRASQPVSATLRFDSVDAGLLDAVRALPEVAAVRARRLWQVSVRTEQGELPLQLAAYEPWDSAELARLQPLQGQWPPARGGLVIEQSAQDLLGSRATGTLTVLRNGETWQLPVQGVARDVAMAPAWMEHLGYGFATPETLQQLGADPGFDSLQFRLSDPTATRAQVRGVAASIANLARTRGHRLQGVDLPEPGEHIHARQMNSLLLTQAAFGIAAIIAAMFLFFNLTTAMLAQEARQIAVLKAIGAGPGKVMLLYLSTSAVQGLLAAVLALPVVWFGGRRYGALKLEMLNFDPLSAQFPWWTLLSVLLVGLGVPMLAAIWPLRRALRVPVVSGLSQAGLEPSSRLWRLPGRQHLPIALRWALDQAFRQPRRALLSVTGLALGGAIFLAAASVRVAMEQAVDHLFRGQRYDVTLHWAEPPPTQLMQDLSMQTTGVERAEVWWRRTVSLSADDGLLEPPFALLGVPANTPLLNLPLSTGRDLRKAEGRQLLVSRALRLAQPTLTVGQAIILIETGPSPWQVIGEFDAGPQAMAYAPAETISPLEGARPFLALRSQERDALAQIDLIQRLGDVFGNAGWPIASSRRPDASRAAIEDHLLMVIDFLRAMGVIMLIVALFNIATLISLGVLERERELAVLRAIGATPGRLGGLIYAEALAIGGSGWLLSLPIAWPAGAGLAKAFGQIMFSLPDVGWPPLPALAVWLTVALGVALLAAALPAWQAQKRTVVSLLQGVNQT